VSAYRTARLTVSRSALENNARLVKRAMQGRRMIAVIKADAYGHGMLDAAAIFAPLADSFAVATIDEAVALREAGFLKPVLVLGGTPASAAREAVARHISLAVYDEKLLWALQHAAISQGSVAHAHLKVDTGMNRVGVQGEKNLTAMLAMWKDAPNVKMEGIFTHFCDSEDPEYTNLQDERFCKAVAMTRGAGFMPYAHAAASRPAAMGIHLHDAARPGVSLYGADVRDVLPDLTPAQRLSVYPVRVAWMDEGETVGYGRTFTAGRRTRVMTVPVGYGDGYMRALSNRAEALVCGKRVKLIGRVCMDQLMLDVTDVPEAGMDSEVVLMGQQGSERITPDELAQLADTIPYEIMLAFHPRLKREVVE